MELLAAASGEAHLRLTRDGRIDGANAAAELLLGAPASALHGQLLSLSFAVDDRARLRELMREARSGTTQERQQLRLRGGGADAVVDATLLPYAGGIHCVLHVAAAAAAAARTPRSSDSKRLRRVLDQLERGALVIDERFVILEANLAARRILERPRLVRGSPLVVDGDGIELCTLAEDVFERRTSPRRRVLQVGDREVAIRATRLGREGAVLLLVETVRADDASSRASDRFARDAAHELRTPIGSILGAAELLLGAAEHDEPVRRHFLELIRREAARAAATAASLLVLARAEAGEEAPRLELIPVGELIEDVVHETRIAYPAAQLRMHAPRTAATFTNRDLALQLLRNLVENAVRHGRSRPVAIVAVELDDRIAIDVSDEGPGMLPEHVQRALEPFAQPAGTSGSGYGLGLDIAARAARVLGGRVELHATPGEGTTARVELPSATLVTT
jgi:signal transduction histidine kinase